MIIHEKGPSKISSSKRRKSTVQKPFVGLINVPRSEHPNPWNCGKSNINKESQGKGGCLQYHDIYLVLCHCIYILVGLY